MELIVMFLCIVGLLLTWIVIKQHWEINRLELQRRDILAVEREIPFEIAKYPGSSDKHGHTLVFAKAIAGRHRPTTDELRKEENNG